MEEHIFKITKDLKGNQITVRILADTKGKQGVVDIIVGRNSLNQPMKIYYCYALVNGHPKILKYGAAIYNKLRTIQPTEIFNPDSSIYLLVNVDTVEMDDGYEFLKLDVEIKESDEYKLSLFNEVKKDWTLKKYSELPSLDEVREHELNLIKDKRVKVKDFKATVDHPNCEDVFQELTIAELNDLK